MRILKKYKFIIAIVLPIVILVIIKAVGKNHFKSDAAEWAKPSFLRSNIIKTDNIGSYPGEKLTINLDNGTDSNNKVIGNSIRMTPDSVLVKNNFDLIRKHDGPVLLYSSDPAIAARIWMVLSQMGVEKIYILTSETDNEVFKNKFRPDTITRPEL